ncbi:hypothetical protein P7M58_23220 [Vibrio parahaemolyticus]|nr:hypothetical protein [Vibrio parahaemolyticus]MDG2997269.1 hypothetical protein [Vibrio parahaemolyticus]
MKKFKNLLLCFFACTVAFQSNANEVEWIKIADKSVSFKSEVDTVSPLSPFSNSKFSSIKIKCTQGTVNLKKIRVLMSDGQKKEFDNLGMLTKGMVSRNLNLPGKGNVKLDKIDLEYESIGSATLKAVGVAEKAKVEILGKQ